MSKSKADHRRDRTDFLMLSIEASRLRSINADLLAALQAMLDAVEPAFRAKPMGAPHSLARMAQDAHIAAEDRARAAIKRATEG